MISDGHDKGLSAKENRGLASIFAAIAEPLTGRGVWTVKWIEGFLPSVESYRQLGYMMSRVFQDSYQTVTDQPDDEEYDRVSAMTKVMIKNKELIKERWSSETSERSRN